MLPTLKRHQVQLLLAAGLLQRDVADAAGVSLRSVQRIAREPTVTASAPKATQGRPSKTAAFESFVQELLLAEPELLSVEVLRRCRLRGYKGGKSAMYSLVRRVRPPPKKDVVVRFEGLPGEFSQHDFGQVDVSFLNGSTKRIHFFASRLKYSRFVHVVITPNQKVEPLVRGVAASFEAFGGVPLRCVFDRPRTVASGLKRDGSPVKWNETFAAAMVELGFIAELCWPRRGNQKGSVENLVGWVKGSFFKQRRFQDLEDLEQQLAEWLHEGNHERPSRATDEIPESRRQRELDRLKPIRIASADLALRVPIFVGPTATVLHEGVRYSMPAKTVGFSGTLFLYPARVAIQAGPYLVEHARGDDSFLPEHRAERLAQVSGARARTYQIRQDLLDLGPPAVQSRAPSPLSAPFASLSSPPSHAV